MSRKWKDQSGTDREDVCFVDLTFFGKSAENANQYFAKGKPLFIEGRLQFETWAAQDGSKRSKHSVIVEKWQFIGGDTAQQRPESTRTRDAVAANGNQTIPDSEIPF